MLEEISDSDDEHEALYIALPCKHADIYSVINVLCYGKNYSVDMLELCGGEGLTSDIAFHRGLSS